MKSGGHRDAAELLSEKAHFLYQSIDPGCIAPEYLYDMDLLSEYLIKIVPNEDLLLYMNTEFGQGYLLCTLLRVIEGVAELALSEGEGGEQ